jgi:hypothetical protein
MVKVSANRSIGMVMGAVCTLASFSIDKADAETYQVCKAVLGVIHGDGPCNAATVSAGVCSGAWIHIGGPFNSEDEACAAFSGKPICTHMGIHRVNGSPC